ncbi:uncharacterized protein LOC62_07G008900 [Vanrija pseudolonga]|uniref:BRCT domain-containing protein n=1 Tax=Vanrija pseudolonga TaxID=143232 RepID=A0AAF0YIS3_9TREE|nr:hypothetical protein LOC62_07G008900 [Vanrija pseudolonga]
MLNILTQAQRDRFARAVGATMHRHVGPRSEEDGGRLVNPFTVAAPLRYSVSGDAGECEEIGRGDAEPPDKDDESNDQALGIPGDEHGADTAEVAPGVTHPSDAASYPHPAATHPADSKIFSDGLDFPVTFYVDPGCSPVLARMIENDGGHLTTPDRAHLLVFNVSSADELDGAQRRLVAEPRFFGSVGVTQEWLCQCILARENAAAVLLGTIPPAPAGRPKPRLAS